MSEVILNEENFESEVIKSNVPVLVDFWATWCGPCQMMGPIIEELAKEMEGEPIKIAKINIDEGQAVAEKYGVMSIPSFKIFKNGEVVDEFTGAVAKEELVERINKVKNEK
ncbi:thioredoxin [Candidatus Falkowbacteria bacterium RIFOXYB2_FULL_38_15]|uniref:Thioredoxin n=1 Tax=Candidatus Falkowbacteria bacterium RIFOXYA2_FULL_38_12 TaxID=1797993 RepID=A0A1F5S1V4_9BACT|nr:MAG: thioredoxin [Candidatus Falkowbacteria bacterium RIFOXYA2_FULL_38_12]OGF33196.1 MAG: thioredoxin [Candidatus Falkowbacteria bacterium RIFOXYB2_FULL_38_15]OGF42119.1 MAG: thioredoxin [Candidatus Falkowbacteria bacterium RIFOXYD2_FULL_39_16]